MALTVEDQGPHDMGFLWENQSWDPSNSDNSGENKDNMKSPNQKEEGNEVLQKKKRSRGNGNGDGKDGKCRESDHHDMHIWTERERRKKMRNMFANLHALLPHLPSKADKSTIVDEAVSYIKNLQQTLEKLEKEKQERIESLMVNSRELALITDQGSFNNNFSNTIMGTSNALSVLQPVGFQTWTSSNMVLNICGDEAQFSICATKKQGLMSTIVFLLAKHNLDLIFATISDTANANANACMILVQAKRAPHQFPDANSLEEIYKQTAREIMFWIA